MSLSFYLLFLFSCNLATLQLTNLFKGLDFFVRATVMATRCNRCAERDSAVEKQKAGKKEPRTKAGLAVLA